MPEGPVYDPHGTRRAPLRAITHQAGSYGGEHHAEPSAAGFQYDEATLRELMHDWNDLANEFADDLSRARAIATAEGPGLEYASDGNAELIRQSGLALTTTLEGRESYCRAMAAKFQTALGKYAAAEDNHSTEINQTGGSL
ncbi:hypothetical protein QRX60_08570 [Amycolatopsis mongoliensis]|uniref:PE domain-containing protein n=1 Tax=Amycolatopsis mongoliensis TaxID=715475 RepID=A0A9Y2JVU1_9PSEU|nr:hypothetical protein [Amycolatopsis sp. 4-36]WIY03889.1 hypothetical protein QRX60_08570 [Amycolatopsis sp. 4-36]